MNEEKLVKLLEDLPKSPGVYIMKDAHSKILYIGKAKNLRNRVRSYFNPGTSDTRFFVSIVRKLVDDIEIVLTNSEKEALLLESNLIKRHTPRYNIRLRDDKDFICLRLDQRAKWPKLEIARRPKKDGADYFGPYSSATAAKETFKLVRRHFRLRICKDRQMANRVRPCLQHQIHRCDAPCVLDVDHDEYKSQVKYVRLFLLGKSEELLGELEQNMKLAALKLDYEKAAVIRDQIKSIKETLSPQRVTIPGGGDLDIIGTARQGAQVQIVILELRGGRMTGRRDFFFSDQEFPDEEILSSFIVQHYSNPEAIPKEILVSRSLTDLDPLRELLGELRGSSVQMLHPKRGAKTQQTLMADRNAEQLLETRIREDDAVKVKLEAIKRRLKLAIVPNRIECIDISHLGGSNTVAGISAVIDGQVNRSAGRTYKVKTVSGGDDYGAMTEVLKRRFTRAGAGEEGWEPPDLLVVDGGRGQLAVALAVLQELKIEGQLVIALAKERSEQDGAESDRIYLPGRKNPIQIKARVSGLQILAMARDEAHRLANTFQKRSREKKATRSKLDEIPGIGPKLRAAMLKNIGSVKRIREASIEQLMEIPGVGQSLAEKIKESLN